jgi:hypothetical protein
LGLGCASFALAIAAAIVERVWTDANGYERPAEFARRLVSVVIAGSMGFAIGRFADVVGKLYDFDRFWDFVCAGIPFCVVLTVVFLIRYKTLTPTAEEVKW